jgi:multiple sugar transport system substrate-binding protein
MRARERLHSRRDFMFMAAGGAALAGLAGACGSGSGSGGGSSSSVINLWAQSDADISGLVSAFEKANPKYNVNLTMYAWDTLYDKQVAGIAGGVVPDVSIAADIDVGNFAILGGLEPLDSIQSSYPASDFFSTGWSHFDYKGHVYGAPAYMDARVLFYRPDILEKAGFSAPPATLDDLMTMGQKISNGNDLFAFGDQTTELEFHVISWLIYEYGGDYYNGARSTSEISQPAATAAINYFRELYANDVAPRAQTKRADPWLGFKGGYYAMVHSGSWWLPLLATQAPEIKGKWSTALLPKGPNNTTYGHPQPWVVFKNSANKAGAEAWIRFMLEPENQAQWAYLGGLLPARKSSYDMAKSLAQKQNGAAGLQAMETFMDAELGSVDGLYNVPDDEQMTESIYGMCDNVKNNPTSQSAMTGAISSCNQQIQQYLQSV